VREVFTWLDIFHVHKDAASTDTAAQVVADSTGVRRGIVAAIADENVFRENTFERF
jgi:hypothetical protein